MGPSQQMVMDKQQVFETNSQTIYPVTLLYPTVPILTMAIKSQLQKQFNQMLPI